MDNTKHTEENKMETSKIEPVIDLDSYEHPQVKLVGQDGNGFYIMAKATSALRKVVGVDGEALANQYKKEAQSGDYDLLLRVTQQYCEVV